MSQAGLLGRRTEISAYASDHFFASVFAVLCTALVAANQHRPDVNAVRATPHTYTCVFAWGAVCMLAVWCWTCPAGEQLYTMHMYVNACRTLGTHTASDVVMRFVLHGCCEMYIQAGCCCQFNKQNSWCVFETCVVG